MRLAVIIVLLAFVGAWLFYFNGLEQATEVLVNLRGGEEAVIPASVSEFAAEHGDKMLSYRDDEYGFTIRYPVGYAAMFAPDAGIRLRFMALGPGTNSEVIDVAVVNGTPEEAFTDLDDQLFEKETREELTVNNRRLLLIKGETSDPVFEEPAFARLAVFDCGNYTAAINAFVPRLLLKDLELVDYMIYSFEC